MDTTELTSYGEKEKIVNILRENGINEEVEKIVKQIPLHLVGEHCASACYFLTVHFKNEQRTVLELFVKTESDNLKHAEIMQKCNAFEKEVSFFNILLKDMQKICKEKSGSTDLIDIFPKIYLARDNLIIMENLEREGYQMIDKLVGLDLQQSQLALEYLARFHAVSFVMISEMGKAAFEGKYPFTPETMLVLEKEDIYGGFFEPTISMIISLLEKSDIKGAVEAHKRLEKYNQKSFLTVANRLKSSNHLFYVFNHGDYWINNVMFEKQNENEMDGKKPLLKVIDMQVTRNASPHYDLGYFIYTSVRKDIRKSQWKNLMKFYFEKLASFVKNDLKSKFHFTFEEFMEDYSINGILGFIYGIFTSAALGLLGDVDPEKSDNYIQDFSNNACNFLEKNPEEAKRVIEETIQIVSEYSQVAVL